MIPCQTLMFVFYSCIYMSYASCQRCSKGATPQSIPNPASTLFVTFPSCSTAREGVFPVFPSGVSLSQAGTDFKASRSRQPSQDCFHRETAIHAGSSTPPLCGSHATQVERHRQSRLDGDPRPRTEAWLSGGQPGRRVRFVWNISSIAYWIPNSPKPTNYWCQTSCGPQTTVRR